MNQTDHRELIRQEESLGYAIEQVKQAIGYVEGGVRDVATRNRDADLYEVSDLLSRAQEILHGRRERIQQEEGFVYH